MILDVAYSDAETLHGSVRDEKYPRRSGRAMMALVRRCNGNEIRCSGI